MSKENSIHPLRDLLLIKKEDPSETTKSGIFISRGGDDVMVIGEVLAVGPGLVNQHGVTIVPSAKVGDRVVFHKSAMIEVKVGDDKFHLIADEQLLAKL